MNFKKFNLLNFKKKKINNTKAKNKSRGLLNEVKRTKDEIFCTENWFNFETNNDLIDACIYKLKSLEAKNKFLLMKTKVLKTKSSKKFAKNKKYVQTK
ncbi:MAG: DUF2508 family protein [Oscillospiraceae bacterium]|jgi:hypothetical protein|nr:DUF2508 family protein [Oscillospiraceae bacterium]